MLLDKSFVGVYQPTPVSLFEDFRALLRSRNAAPRQPGASNRTPGGLDKNTRDTFRDYIGLRATFSYVLSAWIPHVGTCLQFGFLREMRRTWTRFIASRG